jgi:hypothetical protein
LLEVNASTVPPCGLPLGSLHRTDMRMVTSTYRVKVVRREPACPDSGKSSGV